MDTANSVPQQPEWPTASSSVSTGAQPADTAPEKRIFTLTWHSHGFWNTGSNVIIPFSPLPPDPFSIRKALINENYFGEGPPR